MSDNKSKSEPQARSFEEAVHELRAIVQDLESGSLGLQESLAIFEEGTGLLRSCYGYLEDAEQKIELLTRISEDGTVATEPFDGQATVEKTEAKRKKRTRKAQPKKPAATEPDPAPTPSAQDEVAADADVRSLFD